MAEPPARPKIYHITHLDNLARVVAEGGLLSEAAMADEGPRVSIGMGGIKQARLTLPVECHPGDCVGDYVPFYFCPRSIMLYVIYRQNHPNLRYRGGQGPVVHLEADLHRVIQWADAAKRRWAFSLSNAGAFYADFRKSAAQLDQLNWEAIRATDFRNQDVKEGKQAEFLVHANFPWVQVDRVGSHSLDIRNQVDAIISAAEHQPRSDVVPDWYY